VWWRQCASRYSADEFEPRERRKYPDRIVVTVRPRLLTGVEIQRIRWLGEQIRSGWRSDADHADAVEVAKVVVSAAVARGELEKLLGPAQHEEPGSIGYGDPGYATVIYYYRNDGVMLIQYSRDGRSVAARVLGTDILSPEEAARLERKEAEMKAQRGNR